MPISKNLIPTVNKPIVITAGDPNSIAIAITLQAWLAMRDSDVVFVYLANLEHVDFINQYLEYNIPLQVVDNLTDIAQVFKHALPIMHINSTEGCQLGKRNYQHGKLILQALDQAISLTLNNQAKALVTNPVDKSLVNQYCTSIGTFEFIGHTDYLKRVTQVATVPMLLMSDTLKVVPLTDHIPLAQVSQTISIPLIMDYIKIIVTNAKQYFQLVNPKIAILGLNPHAGDNALLGSEEELIIQPAIIQLKQLGYYVDGPFASDSYFNKHYNNYDFVVGMYHDQVLIPLKMMSFNKAVNVSLGLNMIRVSPDHGVAFDVADTHDTNAGSLINAIKLANLMYNNMQNTDEELAKS